jgi:hypothetical protein
LASGSSRHCSRHWLLLPFLLRPAAQRMDCCHCCHHRSLRNYTLAVVVFGFLISAIVCLSLPEDGKLRFWPVAILPALIFTDVSVRAIKRAAEVDACERGPEATYTSDAPQASPRPQVCLILSLERCLLLYDKTVKKRMFIPWPQLTGLTLPDGSNADRDF